MSSIYGPPCIIVYSWALLSHACPRLNVDQGDPEMYVCRLKKRWYTDSCVFRFLTNQDAVEMTVLEIVKENLSRRQAPDSITRNFLKLLTSAAGLVEVSESLNKFSGKSTILGREPRKIRLINWTLHRWAAIMQTHCQWLFVNHFNNLKCPISRFD